MMTITKTVASRARLIAAESERAAEAFMLAGEEAWMSGLESDAEKYRAAADVLRDQAQAVRASI